MKLIPDEIKLKLNQYSTHINYMLENISKLPNNNYDVYDFNGYCVGIDNNRIYIDHGRNEILYIYPFDFELCTFNVGYNIYFTKSNYIQLFNKIVPLTDNKLSKEEYFQFSTICDIAPYQECLELYDSIGWLNRNLIINNLTLVLTLREHNYTDDLLSCMEFTTLTMKELLL